MKNLILETMKYCFTGYNQFLICETKAQAKSYLKQNSSINQIKDLKVITDELRKEILDSFENFFHTVYDISSGYAVPLENEIDESDEEAALGYPNCPNCADQASIAAPGQTVLCKTHADEKHFREMNEFFNDEIERISFKPHTPFCSACGTDKHVVYVGIINTENSGPLVWSFCGDCRDELTLKRNAASAASERIGA